MSRATLAFAVVLLLATHAMTPALAATDDPVTPPAAAAPAPANPMMAAIGDALQQERAQIADLAARVAAAPDDAAAFALQRAIEQTKSDAKLRVLAIQADYARREGRLDAAVALEAAIAAMGRLDVPSVVEERPAPSSNAAGR